MAELAKQQGKIIELRSYSHLNPGTRPPGSPCNLTPHGYLLDGELSDVFVWIGVVEQLQGSLGGEHRPPGQQGVQLQDVTLKLLFKDCTKWSIWSRNIVC